MRLIVSSSALVLSLALPLALIACSEETTPTAFDPQAKADEQAAKERAADRVAVEAGFQPEPPKPVRTESVDPPKTPSPGAILPPADRQYRYIGRWAAKPSLCANGAWRFKVRSLETAGETSCKLPEIASARTGYELRGTCQSEGRKTDQILHISFDENARTMSVNGKTLGPATLIYCGE